MHRLTSALLIGGGVLLTSFINAPAAPTPAPARVSPAEVAAIHVLAPLAAEVDQEAERLRARLAVVVEPPVARRDPFSFGTAPRAPRETAAPGQESAAPAAEVESGPVVVWPQLVAVLTDNGEHPGLRAVLAIDDAVEILKRGDQLGEFLVREITATGVELVHRATSAVARLSLR